MDESVSAFNLHREGKSRDRECDLGACGQVDCLRPRTLQGRQAFQGLGIVGYTAKGVAGKTDIEALGKTLQEMKAKRRP